MMTARRNRRIFHKKRPRLGAFGAAVSAVLIAATVSAPASASCVHAEELAALKLRFQQSQLMVAALSCPAETGKSLRAAYNRFVREQADRLSASAPLIRGYLKRSGGPNIDVFVTNLANDLSLEAALEPGFCQKARSAVPVWPEFGPVKVDALPIGFAVLEPAGMTACPAVNISRVPLAAEVAAETAPETALETNE